MFVQLPKEDEEPGTLGGLIRAMYGTRDAAQKWESEYAEFLQEIACERGIANPCTFFHHERDMRLAGHGDDFTILASELDLDWLRRQIGGKCEVKLRGRVGPDDGDETSFVS